MKAEDIDALLPQTQCGLCNYPDCLSYAKAIAEKAAPINKCLPGGTTTLQALGNILGQDTLPYLANMQQKQKPALKAIIREQECIGCTKCINVCPVDAIMGAAKQMHTVISDACTGCELCLAPCPVDCIDMVASPALPSAEQSRQRYYWHQERQARNPQEEENQYHNISTRQQAISEAVARAEAKKAKQT